MGGVYPIRRAAALQTVSAQNSALPALSLTGYRDTRSYTPYTRPEPRRPSAPVKSYCRRKRRCMSRTAVLTGVLIISTRYICNAAVEPKRPRRGGDPPPCLPFGRSRRHCVYFPATPTRCRSRDEATACRVCVYVVIFCRRAAEIDGSMKILALITVVIYLFCYFLSNNICFYELCTKYGGTFRHSNCTKYLFIAMSVCLIAV